MLEQALTPLSRLADGPGEASGQKICRSLGNGQAPQLSSNLEALGTCGEGGKEKHCPPQHAGEERKHWRAVEIFRGLAQSYRVQHRCCGAVRH